MARPLAHLSDEELRAELTAQPKPAPKTRLVGYGAVVEWALEFGVFPGRMRSIEGADLFRHFLQAGYRLGGHLPAYREFGVSLSRLGLRKGRVRARGVDQRPRLLSQDAAEYFRAWLLENPRSEDEDGFTGLLVHKKRLAS